jgi:RNA polymerase sigma factor (sigma-70 family)
VALRSASDRRLTEQVRAGSERAFEVLFDRHYRPVLGFCYRLLGSHAEAEDVVQLTFLAAHHDLVCRKPPLALRPWLYAIARHRCLSMLRARREWPVEQVPEGVTDDVAGELATREEVGAVLGDVARLPREQRFALVLAVLGDLSYPEIGQILGCPDRKVKALVFQARSSLAVARAARETPCTEIRKQLATLRGGALLRATLRRHLADCRDCRAFRERLRAQRRAAALLPVPAVGWLKRVVSGVVAGSGAGVEGAAVTAGTLNASGLMATALVALAIPAGGMTAAVIASGDRREAAPSPAGASAVAYPTALSRRPPAISEQDRGRGPSSARAPLPNGRTAADPTASSGSQAQPSNRRRTSGPATPPRAAHSSPPSDPREPSAPRRRAGSAARPSAARSSPPSGRREPTVPRRRAGPAARPSAARSSPPSGRRQPTVPPRRAGSAARPSAARSSPPSGRRQPTVPPRRAGSAARPSAARSSPPSGRREPIVPPRRAGRAAPPPPPRPSPTRDSQHAAGGPTAASRDTANSR